MVNSDILDEIVKEVKRAKKKHPSWPVHVCAQALIVSEESGELARAALNYKYESMADGDHEKWLKEMKTEAIQTAATCIRFLENLQKLDNQFATPVEEYKEKNQIDFVAE